MIATKRAHPSPVMSKLGSGGARLKFSGTSMASPNVVNLAAKLFALDPSLTPAQVIELIKQGATASADGRRHLIDEKRSVELLHDSITVGLLHGFRIPSSVKQ